MQTDQGGQMWRFLSAFFAPMVVLIVVLVMVFVGWVIGDASPPLLPSAPPDPAQSLPVSDAGGRDAHINRAADLQRQVSDLQDLVGRVNQQLARRKAHGAAVSVGEQQRVSDAPNVLQQQDSELHDVLQGLIAQLEQELQLEEQIPPASDVAEQQERQTALDGFRHEIADVRRLDNQLLGLMAPDGAEVAERKTPRPPAPDDAGKKQTLDDALEHQAANLRSKIAGLQRQDDTLRRQLADLKEELAEAQEMAQHAHDIGAARAEAETLSRSADRLREQREAEEALMALENSRHGIASLRRQRQAEDAASPPEAGEQQRPAQPAFPQATPPVSTRQPGQPVTTSPRPAQLLPARQVGQPEPNLPPAQPVPAPLAQQQLQTSQQLLSAGRPHEARRLLATVQTQMIFAPVTAQRPAVQSDDLSVSDVADAIHWLDIGASGQAMQSITRAINALDAGRGP
jgi:hypothetical protein